MLVLLRLGRHFEPGPPWSCPRMPDRTGSSPVLFLRKSLPLSRNRRKTSSNCTSVPPFTRRSWWTGAIPDPGGTDRTPAPLKWFPCFFTVVKRAMWVRSGKKHVTTWGAARKLPYIPCPRKASHPLKQLDQSICFQRSSSCCHIR